VTRRARRIVWGLIVALASLTAFESFLPSPPGPRLPYAPGPRPAAAPPVRGGAIFAGRSSRTCLETSEARRHLAGTTTVITPQGASFHAGYEVDLDPALAEPGAVVELLRAGDLEAAARGAIDVAIHSLPPSSFGAGALPARPRGRPSPRNAARRPRGRPGSIHLRVGAPAAAGGRVEKRRSGGRDREARPAAVPPCSSSEWTPRTGRDSSRSPTRGLSRASGPEGSRRVGSG